MAHAKIQDKTPALNIRIKMEQRNLIEQAAQYLNKTVSEFVRDAALHEAQNALLDRTSIHLSEKEWEQFTAALDAEPKDNQRLKDLMSRKPVWEK